MAKGFKFRLQKVLDVRQHQEDQKSIELNHAKQELQREEQKLQKLRNDKLNELQEKPGQKVNIGSLRIRNDYLNQMNQKITSQTRVVLQQDQRVHKKHSDLLEAVKDKKVVELLKERNLFTFRKQQNQEAFKKENEIAIRMTIDKKNNEDK